MTTTADDLREQVRARYAQTALAVVKGEGGCCGDDACGEGAFGAALYDDDARGEL